MRSPRGFVLVTVLWVLAILSLITIGFGRRAMLDRKAATYTLDHDRAMYRARGAVERGIAELRNKAIIDALNKCLKCLAPRAPATNICLSANLGWRKIHFVMLRRAAIVHPKRQHIFKTLLISVSLA